MRKSLSVLLFLLVTLPAFSATSTVTATITDADAQTWNNGTFQVTFVPQAGTPANQYLNSGSPFTQSFTGTMNGSGVLTVTLADVATISPSGAQWRFTMCPNASSACASVVTNAVTGATPNLSSTLSAGLAGPRFAAGANAFGYADGEVSPTPQPGGTYFNVTSSAVRVWSGSAWSAIGGGGGTTINPTNNVIPKRSNATTFIDSAVTDNGSTISSTEPYLSPTLGTCSAPGFAYSGGPSYGLDFGSINGLNANIVCSAGIRVGAFRQNQGGLYLSGQGGAGLILTNGDVGSNSPDLGATRLAASVWALGNGSVNDDTALVRWGMCRVTADITLSTSATNLCSFSLPAVAKPWAWHCDLLWSVTAGTTPTLSVGVNASQTPTAATNAWAELKTSNANVATEAAVTLSASGAVNVLTSPTLTTAATIFSGSSYGTLLASGTAGTFAITMTGTGAGFAGVARAGTTCQLF